MLLCALRGGFLKERTMPYLMGVVAGVIVALVTYGLLTLDKQGIVTIIVFLLALAMVMWLLLQICPGN
jgi:zinc transporter ZupT